ncbi:unnamed protein product [Pedinophyceae sp. YPF-701]|nr:unnamed protein product [Pedinophyceae sp. YPF-701]
MDAVRQADALFETKSIKEIQQIERKTRKDVEGKKDELRRLVGDSYTDVILSADRIKQMADLCDEATRSVADMTARLAGLADSLASQASTVESRAEGPAAGGVSEDIWTAGVLVGYLMETQEAIWGHLDAGEYLLAARRLARAGCVERAFSSACGAARHRFPLLRQQLPAIAKLKGQVVERATARLASERALTPAHAADALAALLWCGEAGAFEESSTAGVAKCLRRFLDLRADCAAAALADEGEAAGQGAAACSAALERAVSVVQSTLVLAGRLFVGGAPGSGPAGGAYLSRAPVLQQLLRAASLDGEDGTLDTLPGSLGLTPAATSADAAPGSWAAAVAAAAAAADTVRDVRCGDELRGWLPRVAATFLGEAHHTLGVCRSAAEVSEVETTARARLANWTLPPALAAMGAGDADGAAQRGGVDDAPASWGDVCAWVGAGRIDLWSAFLEEAVLRRGEELIREAVDRAKQRLREQLDAVLTAADATDRAAPVALTGAGSASQMLPGDGARSAWQAAAAALADGLSDDLAEAVRAAAILVQTERDAGVAAGAGRGRGGATRSVRLGTFTQSECLELAKTIGTIIAAGMPAETDDSGASGKGMERRLALAQLALGIADDTSLLSVCLGPPEAWQRALARAVLSQQPGGTGAATATLLSGYASGSISGLLSGKASRPAGGAGGPGAMEASRAIAELTATGWRAADAWCTWAARALAQSFVRMLASAPDAGKAQAPSSWQDVRVGGGNTDDDVVFKLPCAMSATAASLMFAASHELLRSGLLPRLAPGPGRHGAHAPGLPPGAAAALSAAFAYRLLEFILAELESRCEDASAPPDFIKDSSEARVLQILFDFAALRGFLRGAEPPPSPSPAAGPLAGLAASEAQKEARELLKRAAAAQARCASVVDPIDWATYEPHVESMAAAFQERCGSVLSLPCAALPAPRKHATTTKAAGTGAAAPTVTLATAPAPPRFVYLPFSSPTSAGRGAAPRAKAQAAAAPSACGSGSLRSVSDLSQFGRPAEPEASAGGARAGRRLRCPSRRLRPRRRRPPRRRGHCRTCCRGRGWRSCTRRSAARGRRWRGVCSGEGRRWAGCSGPRVDGRETRHTCAAVCSL